MTSSPPSSGLSPAVPPECPAQPDGNWRRGLRSLRDLTQHLTTRADDSHAAPVQQAPCGEDSSLSQSCPCQGLVRFCALLRIKPHAPPLVRAPVNSFEFQPCGRTPRRCAYRVSYDTECLGHPTSSAHRLRRGLPGYLILFAPHAVAPQRQYRTSSPPSPPVFFPISTNFTSTLGIPRASSDLKPSRIGRSPQVEPRDFTPD